MFGGPAANAAATAAALGRPQPWSRARPGPGRGLVRGGSPRRASRWSTCWPAGPGLARGLDGAGDRSPAGSGRWCPSTPRGLAGPPQITTPAPDALDAATALLVDGHHLEGRARARRGRSRPRDPGAARRGAAGSPGSTGSSPWSTMPSCPADFALPEGAADDFGNAGGGSRPSARARWPWSAGAGPVHARASAVCPSERVRGPRIDPHRSSRSSTRWVPATCCTVPPPRRSPTGRGDPRRARRGVSGGASDSVRWLGCARLGLTTHSRRRPHRGDECERNLWTAIAFSGAVGGSNNDLRSVAPWSAHTPGNPTCSLSALIIGMSARGARTASPRCVSVVSREYWWSVEITGKARRRGSGARERAVCILRAAPSRTPSRRTLVGPIG